MRSVTRGGRRSGGFRLVLLGLEGVTWQAKVRLRLNGFQILNLGLVRRKIDQI